MTICTSSALSFAKLAAELGIAVLEDDDEDPGP